MAGRQDVLYFAPTPPPQGTDVRAVVQWMQVNLDRIADNMREGRLQKLRMDIQQKLPAKPQNGDAAYFAATVAGATEGLYEYRLGAWQKL